MAAPERGPLLANRPLPLFENRAKTFCYVNQVTEIELVTLLVAVVGELLVQ